MVQLILPVTLIVAAAVMVRVAIDKLPPLVIEPVETVIVPAPDMVPEVVMVFAPTATVPEETTKAPPIFVVPGEKVPVFVPL